MNGILILTGMFPTHMGGLHEIAICNIYWADCKNVHVYQSAKHVVALHDLYIFYILYTFSAFSRPQLLIYPLNIYKFVGRT